MFLAPRDTQTIFDKHALKPLMMRLVVYALHLYSGMWLYSHHCCKTVGPRLELQ